MTPGEQIARLRSLAKWYREFASEAENPAIWESRLHTAEDLENKASRLEKNAKL